MGKLTGYVIAFIGLILIALSFFNLNLPLIGSSKMLIVIGIAIVVIGIILALGKRERQLEEVPIYEGEGKKRKIVAYRRMKK